MKRIHFLTALLTLSAFALAVVPTMVAAGPLTEANTKLQSAVGGVGLEGKLEVTVGTVIRGVLSLVGTIFLVLTVYAGILWMTAQGASEQVEKAQTIISAAIIGLFITMAAYAITTFVTARLNPQTNTSVSQSPQTCSQAGGTCKADCGAGVSVPLVTGCNNQLCCK